MHGASVALTQRRHLDHFDFHTLSSVSDGEFVLRQSELNLVAGGETFEHAALELEELVLAYAERYFERLHFYAQTDRAEQMPWLLRLILTPEADRRALLIGAKIHPTPFREALRTGEPVTCAAPVNTEQQVEHEAWVLAVLVGELQMTAKQIEELDVEQARQLVLDHRSRPTSL